MDASIRVRRRGQIALPARLRKKYRIRDGDMLRLIDLDDTLVLTPMTPTVAELAREIEQARVEAGVSMDELLAGLREERESLYQETYGPDRPADAAPHLINDE